MAYKILGQAITTAAAASSVINLVKDPSFSGLYPMTTTSVSSTTATLINSNNPYWRFSNSGSGTVNLSNSGSAAYGSYDLLFTGNCYIYYGCSGSANASNFPSTAAVCDISNAIPVTGSTGYYFAFSYKQTSGTASGNVEISWRDSAGSHISSVYPSSANSSGSWVRQVNTYTSPSNAAYAIMRFSGSSYGCWDGIVFNTTDVVATTFTEPVFPSEVVTTSPFDKKVNGYISETYLTTSGLTYAGALNTLYTVPAGKSTVASTLTITNMSPVATTYRVAVIPSGESLAQKHFVFSDIPLAGNSTQTITIGMTLNAGDVVKVAADTAKVNATLFGSEN